MFSTINISRYVIKHLPELPVYINEYYPLVLSHSATLSPFQFNLSHAEYRCKASFYHYCLVSCKEKGEVLWFG